ncbi:hypothetical protein G6F71_009524 [Rhizopus microsporus]|nr:hypothetical protein G6F71_009524 [Rhizopus microsporus]
MMSLTSTNLADSIDTPWYNPTVSRAAWRAGVGLPAPTDDSVVVPSAPLSFSTARAPLPAGSARVDQRRSTVLEGSDVVPKRRKFLPTIPVRNKQRGPRLNPVTLKALKNKTRFGPRPFPFGMNAVRATKALAQLSKPS